MATGEAASSSPCQRWTSASMFRRLTPQGRAARWSSQAGAAAPWRMASAVNRTWRCQTRSRMLRSALAASRVRARQKASASWTYPLRSIARWIARGQRAATENMARRRSDIPLRTALSETGAITPMSPTRVSRSGSCRAHAARYGPAPEVPAMANRSSAKASATARTSAGQSAIERPGLGSLAPKPGRSRTMTRTPWTRVSSISGGSANLEPGVPGNQSSGRPPVSPYSAHPSARPSGRRTRNPRPSGRASIFCAVDRSTMTLLACFGRAGQSRPPYSLKPFRSIRTAIPLTKRTRRVRTTAMLGCIVMSIIVVHRSTGQRYVLIGTGVAATESATPGAFLGDISPDVVSRVYERVALCDGDGNIMWADSREFSVAEVDGHPPARLLDQPPLR